MARRREIPREPRPCRECGLTFTPPKYATGTHDKLCPECWNAYQRRWRRENNKLIPKSDWRKRGKAPTQGLPEELEGVLKWCKLERGLAKNTLSAYRNDACRLAAMYPERRVYDLTGRELRAFLADEGFRNSPSTVRRRLAFLKVAWKFFQIEELTDRFPVAACVAPRQRRKLPLILTREECFAVLQAAARGAHLQGMVRCLAARDFCVLLLLYGSGLRRSEVINLRMGDIDPGAARLKVVNGKGGKDRVVGLVPMAVEAIVRYVEHSRPLLARPESGDLLILSTHGLKMDGSLVHRILKRVVKAAGIQKWVNPHMLRHSFATQLLQGGAGLLSIRDLLGHSSVSTTEIYLHLAPEAALADQQKSHPLNRLPRVSASTALEARPKPALAMEVG